MKLLDIKHLALFLSLTFLLAIQVSAQTCSEPDIFVAAGETCSNTAVIGPSTTVTVSSGGTMNAIGSGDALQNNGTITSLSNSGEITVYPYSGMGIINDGIIINFSNNVDGVIRSPLTAIENNGLITTLSNFGNISGEGYGILTTGSIDGLVNQAGGLISGGNEGITNVFGGAIANLVNSKTATITGSNDYGIQNNGTIVSLVNYGSITGLNAGIFNGNTISYLTNFGDISTFGGGMAIQNDVSISTLTNLGTLSGGALYNGNYIGVLNNAQGQSGALVLTSNLPEKYNIIISGPSSYGKLDVSQAPYYGRTTFGIYGGGIAGAPASIVTARTYAGVLIGINSPADLNNVTSGNYNGFTWKLSEKDLINGIWDLIVTGASTVDTQQSLVNTSSVLQNTFTLQNTVLANSFAYDCTEFGINNICISAGGRNTAVSASNGLNNTSALLIAAYRPHPNYRVGAYADQNLSVNNAGSTVNLGNNTPLIGLFGAWNERLDGTGTEVKISAAYGQKNTAVTRQVVGTSEAGSGSSKLNSQGAQLTAKYGFGVTENVIVSPYIGMRYTQNNMNGYTEGASSSVTAPLTYDALNTNATTALAGVGASYKVAPQVTTFASAGLETDTNTSNGTYLAAGIVGLTPINFNANPVKTRPTATVGAYYDIKKNQRLGITGIYRQEAYQAVQTTTVMATYTIGL